MDTTLTENAKSTIPTITLLKQQHTIFSKKMECVTDMFSSDQYLDIFLFTLKLP